MRGASSTFRIFIASDDAEAAGLGAGAGPYPGARSAPARAGGARRILAIGHRLARPAGRAARGGRVARGAGGDGNRRPRRTARALERGLHLRDLSAMAPPLRAGRGAERRARLRPRARGAGAGAHRAPRARRFHVAALARGGGALLLLVESRRHHHAGRGMRALGVLLAALVAGCSSVPGVFDEHLASHAEPEQACARWYEALDRAVDDAAVRDAQYARVPGFPYLRADRFTAS